MITVCLRSGGISVTKEVCGLAVVVEVIEPTDRGYIKHQFHITKVINGVPTYDHVAQARVETDRRIGDRRRGLAGRREVIRRTHKQLGDRRTLCPTPGGRRNMGYANERRKRQ